MLLIFRALFWIGLVSLLTPREPNLGLGRTYDASPVDTAISRAESTLNRPSNEAGITHDVDQWLLAKIHVMKTRTLQQVRAEIKQSMRERDRADQAT
ncbi:MAG TPA: hypothetical protein VGM26_01505 [Rhizomicrobium sp.]|jgi:hypothetical protein